MAQLFPAPDQKQRRQELRDFAEQLAVKVDPLHHDLFSDLVEPVCFPRAEQVQTGFQIKRSYLGVQHFVAIVEGFASGVVVVPHALVVRDAEETAFEVAIRHGKGIER